MSLWNIDRGALMVWRRNNGVFFKTWKTNFMPSIFEPLLYLLAMGLGFSSLITGLTYAGVSISYIRFLAPGLIAITAMYGGFFECTYGSFVRMNYQNNVRRHNRHPDQHRGRYSWGDTLGCLQELFQLDHRPSRHRGGRPDIGAERSVHRMDRPVDTCDLFPGRTHVLIDSDDIYRGGPQHRFLQLPFLPL